MFNSFFSFLDPNAPNVVVTKLTLVCATAPGPLELDLTGELGGNSSPAPASKVGELTHVGSAEAEHSAWAPEGSVPGAQQQFCDIWVFCRGVRGEIGQADLSSLHSDIHGSFEMVTGLGQTSAKKQFVINCMVVLQCPIAGHCLPGSGSVEGPAARAIPCSCSSCPSCFMPWKFTPEHSTREL